MTPEDKSGDDNQLNFEIEEHKREIEKLLVGSIEDTTSSELVKAELGRLRDAPDRGVDLEMSEDEAANITKTLQDKKSESRNEIYEWGKSHGIPREDGESDLSYLLKIYRARTIVTNQRKKPGVSSSEDQERLF